MLSSRFALLFLALLVAGGCSARANKPAKVAKAPAATTTATEAAATEDTTPTPTSKKPLPPLPDLPPTGVARIDEYGILITAKGKQRRPADDKKFADVMDDIVLVAPAIYDGSTDSSCDLQNAETGELVANVSTNNIAIGGGTIVECLKLAAHAKVVIMFNSRGSYAKEVSSGKLLPCRDGAVFADDFKTCLRLDTSPTDYGGPSSSNDARSPKRDFPIEICAVEYALCRPLFTVERGLNRAYGTRTWDGAYCADDKVAIVADGKLHIFNARSRRELSVEPAPQKTKVTCPNGKPITS